MPLDPHSILSIVRARQRGVVPTQLPTVTPPKALPAPARAKALPETSRRTKSQGMPYSEEFRQQVRQRYLDGATVRSIAESMHCSHATVERIVHPINRPIREPQNDLERKFKELYTAPETPSASTIAARLNITRYAARTLRKVLGLPVRPHGGKRKTLPEDTEQKMLDLLMAGCTAAEIQKALGVSASQIDRRKREWRQSGRLPADVGRPGLYWRRLTKEQRAERLKKMAAGKTAKLLEEAAPVQEKAMTGGGSEAA
jgi:DNA-directed RNA polymerase specialized sigma24 family protein